MQDPLLGDGPMFDFPDPLMQGVPEMNPDPFTMDPVIAAAAKLPGWQHKVLGDVAAHHKNQDASEQFYANAVQGISPTEMVQTQAAALYQQELAKAQAELSAARGEVNPAPYNQALQNYQGLQAPHAPQTVQAQAPNQWQQLAAAWVASQGDAKTAMNAYAAPYQANQQASDAENKKNAEAFKLTSQQFGMEEDVAYKTLSEKRRQLDEQHQRVNEASTHVGRVMELVQRGEFQEAQRVQNEILARLREQGDTERNNADNASLEARNAKTVEGAAARTDKTIKAADARQDKGIKATDARQQRTFKHQEDMKKEARIYAARVKPPKGLNGQQSKVFTTWLGYKSAITALDAKITALRTQKIAAYSDPEKQAKIQADIGQLTVAREAAAAQIKEARQMADTFGVPLPGDKPDPDKGPAGTTKGGASPMAPGEISPNGTRINAKAARAEARKAIEAGADPAKVWARLKKLGITP